MSESVSVQRRQCCIEARELFFDASSFLPQLMDNTT
jgi:hypothetical protein